LGSLHFRYIMPAPCPPPLDSHIFRAADFGHPSRTKNMPHIIVEYTPNLPDLPFDAMLAAVTRRLADSPEVQDEADLKARVIRAEAFRVGLADSQRGFIHVTVRILAGRSEEAKRDFSRRVRDGMLEHM